MFSYNLLHSLRTVIFYNISKPMMWLL